MTQRSIIHFVDATHQVEIFTLDGETSYWPQFKKWNGTAYYYANYRINGVLVSYRSFQQAHNHIVRSKKRRIPYNILNVLKRG